MDIRSFLLSKYISQPINPTSMNIPVFDSGRLTDKLNNRDGKLTVIGSDIHIARHNTSSIRYDSNFITKMPDHIVLSTMGPTSGGVGVFANTTVAKRFIVRKDFLPGFAGGIAVVCYDSSGNIITGASNPGVLSIPQTDGVTLTWQTVSNLSFGGGCYIYTSSTETNDFQFELTEAVKKIRIIMISASVSSPAKLVSFAIYSTDLAKPTAWSENKINNDPINISDLGAVSGTDATEAFLLAVQLAKHKQKIYIPAGEYTISQSINLLKSVQFIGEGIENTILNFTHTDSKPALDFNGKADGYSDVLLEGFTIKGTSGATDGVYAKYLVNSDFRNIKIMGFGRHGIMVDMGWINRFMGLKILQCTKYGIFTRALAAEFSEINQFHLICSNIQQCEIGVVVGRDNNTFTGSEGYCFKIETTHFTKNTVGNILVSGERNVVIDNNYFEVVGEGSQALGVSPYHIYIGKRASGGLGTAHEISITNNHFNSMNDTRFFTNTLGHAIVVEHAQDVKIQNNTFFKSNEGDILLKTGSKNALIGPNTHFDATPAKRIITETPSIKYVFIHQDFDNYRIDGILNGSLLNFQGFQNIIRNSDFQLTSASNVPSGFFTQSLTFSKDTDGALICTGTNGGTYQQLRFEVRELNYLKGKDITFIAQVKVDSTTVANPRVRIQDSAGEISEVIPKDGVYRDIVVTRKISDSATYVRLSISSGAEAGTINDKIYVRNIRAYVGKAMIAHQLNDMDFSVTQVDSLPAANESLRGRSILLRGGNGVEDIEYICKKLANETYQWVIR